jgi:hypothetical protein
MRYSGDTSLQRKSNVMDGNPTSRTLLLLRTTTATVTAANTGTQSVSPTIATSLELSARPEKALGFVLILMGTPNAEQDQLLMEARRVCTKEGIEIAVMRLGNDFAGLKAQIRNVLELHVNPYTGVLFVHPGSDFTHEEHGLRFDAEEFLCSIGNSLNLVACDQMGTLFYPAHTVAQSGSATQHLTTCLEKCIANRRYLGDARRMIQTASLEKWALGEACGQKVKQAIVEFQGRSGAQDLDLSNMQLKSWPPLPDGVTNLILDNNQLTTVPLGLPSTVTRVSLAGNSIDTFPKDLDPWVRILNLQKNKVTVLPESSPSVREGLYVDLSGNPLDEACNRKWQARLGAVGYRGPNLLLPLLRTEKARKDD